MPRQDTVQLSNRCISSAPIPSTLWSLTLKDGFHFQPVMDEAGGAGGGDAKLQSGGSSGTVINGLLPETSAARLSIIGRAEKLSEGMPFRDVRSPAVGGHATTPFEVFITVFLSLHDQSDSRTGCCALTRTVFSACNKSMISTDDKRAR